MVPKTLDTWTLGPCVSFAAEQSMKNDCGSIPVLVTGARLILHCGRPFDMVVQFTHRLARDYYPHDN